MEKTIGLHSGMIRNSTHEPLNCSEVFLSLFYAGSPRFQGLPGPYFQKFQEAEHFC